MIRWLKEIIGWFIDNYQCLRHGHAFREINGTYNYCLRCGHLEVTKRGSLSCEQIKS